MPLNDKHRRTLLPSERRQASVRHPLLHSRRRTCCKWFRRGVKNKVSGSHYLPASRLISGCICSALSFSSRVSLNMLFQFNLDWFRVPDFLAVLPNRTIGGKFAHSGRIENRHPRPVFSILIRLTDLFLAFYIGFEIRENQVWVVPHKRVYQWLEQVAVAAGEASRTYLINHLPQLRIRTVVIPRLITGSSFCADFFRG